ncbi:MAG: bifunctional diguanylate cyclase/phosphodiesterase, partial [Sphingobacteriaceae bacterium]
MTSLVVLLLMFTGIDCIGFIVRKVYYIKFKKAVDKLTNLNDTLILNQKKLNESRNQLHALINSINDIVFEVNEDKKCLNVWYNEQAPLHFDPKQLLETSLGEIIGEHKARPFAQAIDSVIQTLTPTSLEFPSLFGIDKWFLAKMTPVYDLEGKYTSRISVAITDISAQKKFQLALVKNESMLLEAHAIAKLGNWWFNAETRENYWSGNLYRVLEIIDIPGGMDKFKYYIKLVHPADVADTINYFTNISTSSSSTFEHKLITPKGNLKYLKVVRGEIIRDESGQFKSISGVIQDITEIRLSEKSAKISQAELIEAQTIAKIGNWKLDLSTGLLTWSDEIANIYEIEDKAHPLAGLIRMFFNYVHPDDRPMLKKVIKSPDDITNNSYEYRINTATGNIKYLSIIVGKLIKRNGTLHKITGTIQDI